MPRIRGTFARALKVLSAAGVLLRRLRSATGVLCTWRTSLGGPSRQPLAWAERAGLPSDLTVNLGKGLSRPCESAELSAFRYLQCFGYLFAGKPFHIAPH